LEEEQIRKIVRGWVYTNAGAKKLSSFYDIDIEIIKDIIKNIKLDKYQHFMKE
tara:strand:- start:15 stop:173 length:159 start_codon:yes stop_codon:yes gene_type:complete